MKYSICFNGILFTIFFFCFLIPGRTQNHDQKFLLSVESCPNGRDFKFENHYSYLLFEVNPSNRWGKLHYTAQLKKSIVSFHFWRYWMNVSGYYETGETDLSTTSSLLEIAAHFLETHPVKFRFENETLVFENADSLSNGFLKEVSLYHPKGKSQIYNPLEKDFSIFKLLDGFKDLALHLPDDLVTPGDMSLKEGVVYEYKEEVMNLRHIRITDVKMHSQSDVFIREGTTLFQYKKSTNFADAVIVRAYYPEKKYSMHVEGICPNHKNKIIDFRAEGISPLDKVQTIPVNTDAFGKFSLNLDFQHPVNIASSLGFQLYLEPGDQLSVRSNLKGDSLFFSGIGAGNNQYIWEESRLEKFPVYDFGIKNAQTQKSWFLRADMSTNTCFQLLKNQSNNLSPRFFESKLLDYYFGKINRKLDYMFGWYEYDANGIKRRTYSGLDSIPNLYQSFVYNQEYNRYLANCFLLQFEKLRNFIYIRGDNSNLIPTRDEIIKMSALTYSGKILRDFLEFEAPQVFNLGKQADVKTFLDIVNEYFDKTSLRKKVLALGSKTNYIETGSNFPEIKFLDTSKHEYTLSSYRGKLVYLMFWRNDALVLDKQWNDYMQLALRMDPEKVAFAVVGMEPGFDQWKTYVEGMNLRCTNLFIDRNSDDFKKFLGNIGSRQFMLIDNYGKVVNNNGPNPFEANLLINRDNQPSVREGYLLKILIAVVSVLLMLGLVWAITQIRRKRKARINDLLNRLRETELKAIKAQMNPHFLFNSLNSIQNLINQNEIQQANQYLSKFARLLRSVLQYSEKELIPLTDELETTYLYVQLEKLRFNFEYELQVDPKIDIYNTYVPPLLIQPFIENAILHGLQPKQGEKQLKIQVEEENNQLLFRIADNGVGFKNGVSETNHHSGMGNKLSQERIDLLNQKNKGNFRLSIGEGPDDSGGTCVYLSFANNLM